MRICCGFMMSLLLNDVTSLESDRGFIRYRDTDDQRWKAVSEDFTNVSSMEGLRDLPPIDCLPLAIIEPEEGSVNWGHKLQVFGSQDVDPWVAGYLTDGSDRDCRMAEVSVWAVRKIKEVGKLLGVSSTKYEERLLGLMEEIEKERKGVEKKREEAA
ncbi:hypothetical protein F0562_013514 [Nyssa sinensis]|uniref:ENT domain-containing protein n=1 Tax=Nyssa sinensis TaxID=561372 RepID=A0A5J4ZNM9_9ASTE|nr:hypothetical protein F0562_013514 [Nyssa sinensis]